MDDKSVDIGVNLDCALRHIRIHAPKGLWIWIDALCINQDDITERNHQVALMAGIYSPAGQVVIWLGPKCPKDDYFLARICNHSIVPMIFLTYKSRNLSLPYVFGRGLDEHGSSKNLHSLEEIPYFTLAQSSYPGQDFGL